MALAQKDVVAGPNAMIMGAGFMAMFVIMAMIVVMPVVMGMPMRVLMIGGQSVVVRHEAQLSVFSV
jgi:tetrahydromethanopterin S-methyltransferase subunit E